MIKLFSIFRFSLLIGLLLQPMTTGAAVQPVILILGDSLSASYGIHLDQGWVARLQDRLVREGYPHQVVNASISGETTRGALARLDTLLDTHKPEIVIVELGGNDGLRGLSLSEMERNFSQIIEKSQQSGARVLLISMRLPPNYGSMYTEQFQKLFANFGDKYKVAIAPFILDGIATRPELMQPDGIHPRPEAQVFMLDNVWPALVPLLP
jgi:acyl-CoA thioesterase-1